MDAAVSQIINILEVTSSLAYAGGQRNMVTFAKYFRRQFFEVFVGVYASGGPLEAVLAAARIPYVIGHGSVQPLLASVRDNNIHVIHIHRSGGMVPWETEFIQQAKRINPQIVVVEKNVFGKYDASLDAEIHASCFQSMMHLNERYLPRGKRSFDKDTMKVVYNMVDDEEFGRYRASEVQINEWKARHNIAPQSFVVGKVARAAIEKWSDLLLEAMPTLTKLVPEVVVVVIGCPESRVRRINRSRFRAHFRLLPETSDQRFLHTFYQSIDVLAHASKIGECNGNTINEAMYWRRPVVVNSTPRKDNGQLEQVVHLVSGIIANTPPTYARALAYLAHHTLERTQMGERARAQVQSNNAPASIVPQLEKLFLERLAHVRGDSVLPASDFYATVSYNPTPDMIIAYPRKYRQLLRVDFGRLTPGERIFELLRLPIRWYYKCRDFIDHRFRSYGKDSSHN